MADGIAVTAGSGTTILTDDTGAGGHAQVVKLAISTDGSPTLIPAEATYGLDVDVTHIVPGTAASDLGKAEDNAHTSGDVGVMALAVRRDTAAASSGTTGDYEPLSTDDTGRLRARSVLVDSSDAILSFAAPAVLSASPTVDTSAYAALDSMHTTIITFSNAAVSSGGTGTVVGAGLVDKADQTFTARLWLFNQSFTGTTANNALVVSDSDLGNMVGWVDFLTWADGNTGKFSMGDRSQLPLPYICSGSTSLFGVLQVLSGTPTFGASDITVKIHVYKD